MRRSASSSRAGIILGALAVLVLGWSGTAAAEKKRVGVPKFDGPQENVVRRAVMNALSNDYDVVGGNEIAAVAKQLGAELDSNDGFKAVAKELSISAFVTGEVGKKKAKLTVRNGADGSVSGEGSFAGATAAKIASEVQDSFSRRLGSAVERGRAPAGGKKAAAPVASNDEEEAPASSDSGKSSRGKEKEKEKDKEEAPAASSEAPPEATDTSTADTTVAKSAPPPAEGEVGPRALDVEVGLRGFSRSLSYNQDYYRMLRGYNLALGPAIGLRLVTYPAGFVSDGIAAAFGAELNVDYAFGVGSNIKPGAAFPMGGTVATQAHDFNGGVRARLMLGNTELSGFGGYGEHAFVFRSTSTINRGNLDIPDVIYRYARFGLDARVPVAPGFTLGLNAAYRYVVNQGGQDRLQIAYLATDAASRDGYFPYLQVGALDASATVGYQITPSLEARFGVDLRRYFFTMNSSNGAYNGTYDGGDLDVAVTGKPVNRVAGGAVDQYIGFTVGVAYVFGGVPPGAASSSGDDDAAPKKKRKKKKKSSDDEAAASGESGGGQPAPSPPAGGGDDE
jgi:hypothetical protein